MPKRRRKAVDPTLRVWFLLGSVLLCAMQVGLKGVIGSAVSHVMWDPITAYEDAQAAIADVKAAADNIKGVLKGQVQLMAGAVRFDLPVGLGISQATHASSPTPHCCHTHLCRCCHPYGYQLYCCYPH